MRSLRACLAAALVLCLAARAEGAPLGAASQPSPSTLLKTPESAPLAPMPEAKAERWPPLKANPKRDKGVDNALWAVLLVGLGFTAVTVIVIEASDDYGAPERVDMAEWTKRRSGR